VPSGKAQGEGEGITARSKKHSVLGQMSRGDPQEGTTDARRKAVAAPEKESLGVQKPHESNALREESHRISGR